MLIATLKGWLLIKLLMLSLLMCGGMGKRLKKGEKPLFEVCGKKLVDHALEALRNHEVIAVTSPYTTRTEEYLRAKGVKVYRARGRGFIEDYREAISGLKLSGPILIVCSDIIYLRDGILDEVVYFYQKSNKKALKVVKNGCAVGINIIVAEEEGEQEEESYIVDEVLNINTEEDARRAEIIWTMMKKGKDLQKS
ncbi:MAG: NTP transferase domain-containing protein [Archaeoglobaceae archaeon]